MKRILFILVVFLTAASGCKSIDFDFPKQESVAYTQTENTVLGKQFASIVDKHPNVSGFRLQGNSINALGTRLLITKRAERSIDAQYYQIKPDPIGYLFIGSLLQAADRGVRVRLLIDDFLTHGHDAGIAAFDSHPNIEVRVFNPFAGRKIRLIDALTDFRRINRRMHNKSFTVDNQITVVGGRNIASEYFGARSDVNFGDLDVIAVGPIVQDVSSMFDEFWNHKLALPVAAYARASRDQNKEFTKLRERIKVNTETIKTSPYKDAVRKDFYKFIAADSRHFIWAPSKLTYDSPDKALKTNSEVSQEIITTLKRAIDSAKRELVVLTPYFVPRQRGVELFKGVRNNDINVTVVTNSLASTNHPIVHSGYAPSRKPLLELGLKIYEVKRDVTVPGASHIDAEDSEFTLHSKAFIVDRKKIFIGSFNWDPRSVNINTEMGVIIDSNDLANQLINFIDRKLNRTTYEVVLNSNKKIRWIDNSSDEPTVLNKEPNTSWWKRFKNRLMSLLPIKSQL